MSNTDKYCMTFVISLKAKPEGMANHEYFEIVRHTVSDAEAAFTKALFAVETSPIEVVEHFRDLYSIMRYSQE